MRPSVTPVDRPIIVSSWANAETEHARDIFQVQIGILWSFSLKGTKESKGRYRKGSVGLLWFADRGLVRLSVQSTMNGS